MVLFRFVVEGIDLLRGNLILDNETIHLNDEIVLRRANGFFENRKKFYDYALDTVQGTKNIVIYTDDETLLALAEYDDKQNNFNVEMLFPDANNFIPLRRLYPNIRKENNLMSMYHRGIFHDAYAEGVE